MFFETLMITRNSEQRELQSQIENTNSRVFSTTDIEERIAQSLLAHGEFSEDLGASELEVILRNIVYVMFARQKVAGREVSIVHNVPIMKIEIDDCEANIDFVVHIHKPVIVFIEFKYTLVNHPEENNDRLCLKEGSLHITERTRRFDIKAKAAMTAMNVPKIARKEMSDLTEVIRLTLPNQLQKRGAEGDLEQIHLCLNGSSLRVHLAGEFKIMNETM